MADEQSLSWQRLDTDSRFIRGPIRLWGVVLTSDGLGNAAAALYEGANIDGRRLLVIDAPEYQTVPLMFPKPIYLERGLYLEPAVNVLDVLIIYESLQE